MNPATTVTVYLTHDIDWLAPRHPYSLLKWALPNKHWLSWTQLNDNDIFLKQVERMLALEQQLHVSSIFLLGAAQQQFGRNTLRYTTRTLQYKALIELLRHNPIGLHSTPAPLQQQLDTLQAHLQRPIRHHRSHNMHPLDSAQAETLRKNGLRIDFTLGNLRYPQYEKERTQQGLLQIPTLLSDNAFFFNTKEVVIENFKYNLERALENRTSFALLFHPENSLLNPELMEYYAEIIALCKQQNTIFASI